MNNTTQTNFGMVQLGLVDWKTTFQKFKVWCTSNPFMIYPFIFCTFLTKVIQITTGREASKRSRFGVPLTHLLFVFFLLSHLFNKSCLVHNEGHMRAQPNCEVLVNGSSSNRITLEPEGIHPF